MAAYAALVSLENIIHNLEHHSRPPITLHKEQAHLLTQKLNFLQEFLQLYNPTLPYSKEADPLEARIARAAYAAEDAIESHIFDKVNNNDGEKMSLDSLYGALEKVIEDMALIENEAIEIRETLEFNNQLQTKSTPRADSSRSAASSTAKIKSMMVGADDLLLEMKDKLTSNARDLQTIPIVGMGGSGKTTLALNIYQDGLIKEHFDIRAWVTISQEYNILEILIQLLTQLTGEPNRNLSEGELGEMLHKHLYGRKFITILDDMWSLKAWDGVKRYLPDNKNGSRIVITTRITTLASTLSNSNSMGMKLLDEDDSWDLLSKTVFGEKGFCPLELEEIGKKIGKSCKGLPLSIVVVGGLLAKSEQTIESWGNTEENLNGIVNLDDGERCLKTLYMSYKQLPVHLKPCFLYMGIYHEDCVIRTSKLIKLWVAEGFLKPVNGKRLEDVGRAYLKDLIDRNLIMIHKLGSIGSIKKCKVHDLLRDLCLREAQKEGFYTVCPGHEIHDRVNWIVMYRTMNEIIEIDTSSSSAPRARSLILNDEYSEVPPHIFKMLRIVCFDKSSTEFEENVHRLVNLRFFRGFFKGSELPSLIWLLWNLQTLIVNDFTTEFMFTVPDDIWHMSHIRHLEINDFYLSDPPPNVPDDVWHTSHIRHLHINNFYLSDPPPNVQANDIVLANLQSLGWIKDFTCSEQMVKKIPNIRTLKIYYEEGVDDRFCLTNLDCMNKLETLNCCFIQSMCLINYPQSLKKLTLQINSSIYCQDILDKIGALPLLEKLKLYNFRTFEGQWETTEGQFHSLKFLALYWLKGMQVWKSEASHFPRLEQLVLYEVRDLEEIPLDFAEISTLRLIEICQCNHSILESAKRILEEHEALYGEEETTLQIQVLLSRDEYEAPEGFKSPNFQFTYY